MRILRFATFSLLVALVAPLLGQQPNRLVPGRLTSAVFPPAGDEVLLNGESGYFLDVPPDAVRVDLQLTTVPPDANVDLFMRAAVDVQRTAAGDIVADHSSRNPGGEERIILTADSNPPIQPGTRYFVAVTIRATSTPQTFGFFRASAQANPGIGNLVVISSDDFEDSSTNGWTRNFPAPDPPVPGASTGSEDSNLVVRSRSGFTRTLQIEAGASDKFLVSQNYLGRLSSLSEAARLEFDLAYRAEQRAKVPVEIFIMSGRGIYRWTSNDEPTSDFRRFFVPLSENSWLKISGSDTFKEVLDNVVRMEIRADYGVEGGVTHLDNVALLGAPVIPVTPQTARFESSLEGWTLNVSDAPFLRSRAPGATEGDFATARNGFSRLAAGGNPGGYLLIQDINDRNRDYLVAPESYLGNLASLGPQAVIQFDRRHVSNPGASRGVEVRLIGFGTAYVWIGPNPTNNWSTFRAPLTADNWERIVGEKTFAETLAAVQRIEVAVDETAGSEQAGFDNFILDVPPPVVPELIVSPEAVSFNAIQGESAPTPARLDITSNGPILEWIAAADAPWIGFDQDRGQTPTSTGLFVDPTGLAPGTYQGTVEIAWIGSAETEIIEVTLNVGAADGPVISRGGVVSAATFAPNSGSPGLLTGGMFVAVFGQRLAGEVRQAAALPFPPQLGDTTLTIGGLPAPLVFVSPLQLVGVLPQALTDNDAPGQAPVEFNVVVRRRGVASPPEVVRVAAVNPLLFSQDQTGSGPGAILNVISSSQVQLNTFESPTRPNDTVTLYGTGFGPVESPLPDGFAAGGINRITGSATVRVGGVAAQVQYIGLSPNSPHLYQANVTVPDSSPLGCEITVEVEIDGVVGNTVTMAITPNGEPCR